MHKIIIFLLIGACVLCSCDKETEPVSDDNSGRDTTLAHEPPIQETYSDVKHTPTDKYSFIQGYVDADVLNTSQNNNSDGELYPCIYVYMDGATYDWNGMCFGDEKHDKHTIEVFKKYSEQLGDTLMPQSEASWHYSPCNITVVFNKITDIEVICNENFDENHKKGSSVSDILTFYGSTPVKYIKRGYTWIGQTRHVPQGISSHYPDLIICNAADIAENDVAFYDGKFLLYFDQLPDNPGSYTFDVVIKFTDKELRNEVTMKF